MARYHIEYEVTNGNEGEDRICFQYGYYHDGNGEVHRGYRFIWRKPNGHQHTRPSIIPSYTDIEKLIELAANAGWYKIAEDNK